ncbi:hypothetical protein CXG81DRAFT_4646, partial [Caulochytrium protostelioides]
DMDALMREFERTPLFMTSLPTDDDEPNVTLDAIQSLLYDGTPDEIAQTAKQNGNQAFMQGRAHYKDAIQFYTQGIQSDPQDAALLATLYCNRAAVNLELKNLGRCLRDCAEAIARDQTNIKAFFRAAKASRLLGRWDDALDCCTWGLGLDAANAALLAEQELAAEGKRKAEAKAQADAARAAEREADMARLVSDQTRDPLVRDAMPQPVPEETDVWGWPVLLLYPDAGECDLIESLDERATLADILEQVLDPSAPAPWNMDRHLTLENACVYFQQRDDARLDQAKLVPVQYTRLTLREIMAYPMVALSGGAFRFVVM